LPPSRRADDAPRLIAVVGATATGKSEVAVHLAETFGGEVVNADAYQVYRGLDIGTAKPSAALRARVPHHLIDVRDPDDPLSLAGYLDAAQAALDTVWRKGRLPVLAGGSGQYVWAVLEGWSVPRVEPDPALRAELEAFAAAEGATALHDRLVALDPAGAAPIDATNVRRVVRAIEVVTKTGRTLAACQLRTPPDAETLVLGLRCDRAALHVRVDARVDAMFAAGLVGEVEALRKSGYGEAKPLRSAIGYRQVSDYLDGAISLDEAVVRTKTETHRLVRMQANWFRADDERIHWVEAGEDAAAACAAIVSRWLAGDA
jgi:tRNA dimethylallyltransferase